MGIKMVQNGRHAQGLKCLPALAGASNIVNDLH